MYYQMIGFAQGAAPEPSPALPPLDVGRDALFLDFDGTLVDLAPRPDAITVPEALPRLLSRLHTRLEGRLALVSGRSVEDLRKHLPQFPGAMAGGHGAQRRLGGRLCQHPLADSPLIARIQFLVAEFTALLPGVKVERKPTGVVAHYRHAPDAQARLYKFFETLVDSPPDLHLQMAHAAYELRPSDVGKDRAIAKLMDTAPFRGARPVFAGDDPTDEPALAWCQDNGGLGIKIGAAPTCARHALAEPREMRAHLAAWLA